MSRLVLSLGAKEAGKRFAQLVTGITNGEVGRVVITRRGQPVAVMLSIDDFTRLTRRHDEQAPPHHGGAAPELQQPAPPASSAEGPAASSPD